MDCPYQGADGFYQELRAARMHPGGVWIDVIVICSDKSDFYLRSADVITVNPSRVLNSNAE